MAGLLDPQNASYPGDNLVRGRVGWFVEVYDTVGKVVLQLALQRRRPGRDRGVVPRADVQLVVVLQQQWPRGGVDDVGLLGRFDHVIIGSLRIPKP